MNPTFGTHPNPISTGLARIFATAAIALVLIHIVVDGGTHWSELIQAPGLGLTISGLAGAAILAGLERSAVSPQRPGLPAWL